MDDRLSILVTGEVNGVAKHFYWREIGIFVKTGKGILL